MTRPAPECRILPAGRLLRNAAQATLRPACMALVHLPAVALAWLGRQGPRAIAVSIFVGLALPPLAALFKPFVTEQIFVLLCLAFLRVEPVALGGHIKRPALVVAATVWTMMVVPFSLGWLFQSLPLAGHMPGLLLALILQTAAPPLMAAPAVAAMLRLDAALTLTLLVLSIIMAPLTAPAFAQLFVGAALDMSALALGLKLFLLLAGAALVAAAVRRFAGRAWVERQHERIDGLNVLVLFAFAVALMDGVAARIIAEPLLVLGLIIFTFALSLAITAVTTLVFTFAGPPRAFTIGLAAGGRNMGLMLAATGGAVPDLTWLYFALAQFPVYLLPQLLLPVARRMAPTPAARRGGDSDERR
jgi:hypothetical protein